VIPRKHNLKHYGLVLATSDGPLLLSNCMKRMFEMEQKSEMAQQIIFQAVL